MDEDGAEPSGIRRTKDVPVFYPTMDDMRGSFERYVESIEDQFAWAGICKIIPPKSWTPRKAGYDDVDFIIPKPIRQHASGRLGLFRTILVEHKEMSVKHDFKPVAEHPDSQPRFPEDQEAVEREFWKKVTYTPPLYGADVEGSLFDEKCNGWSIRNLNTLLSRTLDAKNLFIPGVTTPYLYFGMWRSTFAWHTEDMDLFSVNYLHYGQAKSWYTIAPEHRQRFETLVNSLVPDLMRSCDQFLRHKELIISPQLLARHNIPVLRVTQHPREFIINFPGAYHAGFNHGYNCAESTNFGTQRWIPIGAKAKVCNCSGDSVQIDMGFFLDESERFCHPEAPKKAAAAAATTTTKTLPDEGGRRRGRPPGSTNKAKRSPVVGMPTPLMPAPRGRSLSGRMLKSPNREVPDALFQSTAEEAKAIRLKLPQAKERLPRVEPKRTPPTQAKKRRRSEPSQPPVAKAAAAKREEPAGSHREAEGMSAADAAVMLMQHRQQYVSTPPQMAECAAPLGHKLSPLLAAEMHPRAAHLLSALAGRRAGAGASEGASTSTSADVKLRVHAAGAPLTRSVLPTHKPGVAGKPVVVLGARLRRQQQALQGMLPAALQMAAHT